MAGPGPQPLQRCTAAPGGFCGIGWHVVIEAPSLRRSPPRPTWIVPGVPLSSLALFLKPRAAVIRMRNGWLTMRYGVKLGARVQASLSSRFHTRRRGSIEVGDDTLVAFKTLITSYDPQARLDRDIRIGSRCFIGGGSVILPGVIIGEGSIIGAGSVVFESVPAGCLAAGNPASILRRGITVGAFGRMKGADERTQAFFSNLGEAPSENPPGDKARRA